MAVRAPRATPHGRRPEDRDHVRRRDLPRRAFTGRGLTDATKAGQDSLSRRPAPIDAPRAPVTGTRSEVPPSPSRLHLSSPVVVATSQRPQAIVAEGLVKVYRSRKSEVRALDGVDLVVEEGTVLGLLGPNGAGKTTTVRILATLLRADAGRATVAGFDVRTQADAIRRVIGLSGQYAAVDENLTGRENLWLFGRLYHLSSREARRRADELLEQFELTDAADRVVKTYSGGMRRRLDLGGGAHRPTAPPDPRRADHGPRSSQPDRHVGRDPRPRPRRDDAAADDPVPRGSRRAGRHDRRRRPRQDHRARHGGRAQVPGWAASGSR